MSEPVNDGYKIYTLLVEMSTQTGLPTGRTKPNLPTDPDYIPPVEDLAMCPLPGSDPEMEILLVIDTGFALNFKILYGQQQLVEDEAGVWSVPNRTYDGVIFEVLTQATPFYKVRVHYNNGEMKEITQITGLGSMYVQGPFPAISKLEILASGGDFNRDFNNDFDK